MESGRVQSDSVRADIAAAADRVRTMLSEAIVAKGVRLDEPLKIGQELELARTMGWKLSRLARSADPIEAALQMPGNEGLGLVVAAMERAGIPKAVHAGLSDAVETWQEVVHKHAGDGTTLQLMLAGLAGKRDTRKLENQRKWLFQGASSVWGVQTEAIIRIDFYGPTEGADLLTAVGVRCLAGFRRLRPVNWTLSHVYMRDDGELAPESRLVPLDPDIGPSEAHLLKAFCSDPTPVVERRQADAGYVQEVLVGGDCGNSSKLDLVMCDAYRGACRHARPGDAEVVTWQRVRTPAEWLHIDMLVHESMPNLDQMYVRMRSELDSDVLRRVPADDPCWLPFYEPILDCGKGPSFPPVSEYSRHGALLRHVFEHEGWDAGEFRLFRLRMKYPPISTAVRVAWPLSPPPA